MHSDIFQENDSAGSLLAPEKRYSPNSVTLIARDMIEVRLFGYTLNEVPSAAQWTPKAYPDEVYRKQISQGEKT